MLRSRARSPSPGPSARPVGRAKAARGRSPSPRPKVDRDLAEKPADAVLHAVEDTFAHLGIDDDGCLDRDSLVSVLKELDPDTWSDTRLHQLLPIKGSRKGNKIQFRDFLNWVFHDGADQAALQSTSVSAIFSYGTLRGDLGPKGDRWGVVEEYKAQWQPARIRGFRLFQEAGCFYPLAIHTGNHDDVLVGTVLQFPDRSTAQEAINRCNMIEGYDPDAPDGGLYRRTIVKVEVPGDRAVVSFIYYKRLPEYEEDYLWLGFKGLSNTHIEHIAFPRRPLGLTYPKGIVTKVKPEGLAEAVGVQPGWHIVSVNFADVSALLPSEIQGTVSDAIAQLPEDSNTTLDGSWTVQFEDGKTEIIELEDGEFTLFDESYTLELKCKPVQFKWPDGTLQQLVRFADGVVEWSTTSTDPAYQKVLWRRRMSAEMCKQITHFPNGDWLEKPVIATFGFGSNSVRQLRGRLGDRSLRGFPAKVFDHALAFAGPNWTWSVEDDEDECGTATLVPMAGQVALGTVAFLTDEQLEVLDGFEGVPYVYQRKHFPAEVLQNGCWNRMLVVAYIKVARDWYAPSEAYKCAVLRNISGSFPACRQLVLRDTDGEVRGEWQHPGYSALRLGSFLFEVGVRKAEPWELPRQIGHAKQKLSDAGIGDTVSAVAASLETDALPFSDEEKGIFCRLLAKSKSMDEAYVSDMEDDSQAERADESSKPKAKSRGSARHSRAKASPRARSPARR